MQNIVSQILEFGETRRGWLGVRIQTVNDELADALGLDRPEGALVAEVTPGGPAEAAGIEAGDVIVEFNGQRVQEMRDLPRIVADTPVDATVPVIVIREGDRITLDATIALLDEDAEPPLPEMEPGEEPKGTDLPDLGMTLSPLSQSARVDFGIAESVEGVLVTEVAPDGQAAEKGVARGDVIVEVAQEPVQTPAEVEERIAEAVDAGRKSVLFLVHSQGELRFVPLTLGQN